MPAWNVYIVRCADGTLYTGVAMDVARRVGEHNSNKLLAANYTRARRPVTLVYSETAATRSAACKREYQIKQLSRQDKEALVAATGRSSLKSHLKQRDIT
jgi:putative endonuclease